MPWSRPRRGGMLRDPEMDDTPTVTDQQHEHEQHASDDRGDREKSSDTLYPKLYPLSRAVGLIRYETR
jgi:hypothetical protein